MKNIKAGQRDVAQLGAAHEAEAARLSLRRSLFLDSGNFVRRCLRHELESLARPILALKAPAELEVVIHQRDFLVREVRKLLELDHADFVQALLIIGFEPLDELEVVGIALGPLEALEFRLQRLRPVIRALGDAGRFATQAAQIINFARRTLPRRTP